ncbi:jg21389 [Pararge aegeria aegeria]|uniref:Jg21389 protein n=1 Tax=Pararge aegeria aegeria TaxID=348720 RepID=A0A8S4RWW8_9NEOP|nr:jg21389 [Pararge aegeria aegeria]
MKDKRLELKLSVRGDGSLSRSDLRGSTRSNRSNLSNSSSALPVNEIFATDRFSAPQNRAFDILDKYRSQRDQYGYPAQSLQGLNQYDQQQNETRYGIRDRQPFNQYGQQQYSRNPQTYSTQYVQPVSLNPSQYPLQAGYQLVYVDPATQIYSTLPRNTQKNRHIQNPIHYTLPRFPKRVRISENDPVIHDYGTLFKFYSFTLYLYE